MIAFLYLARLFGVVPFLKIEKQQLVATKWTLRTSLFFQSSMVTSYLVYLLNQEKIKYLMFGSFNSNDADDVPYLFTCIVTAFNYAVDLISLTVIVLMSQKTHKVLNVLLQKFAIIDHKFSHHPKSKAGFFAILALSVYIARTYYVFSRYDRFQISFNVGSRFIYGMTLFTEMLISLTCMEIKSRYAKLHSLLKTSNGNCNLEEVRALHTIYSSLRDGHSLFAWHVRKVLLTDISQMVMLIVNGILSVYVICLNKEDREQSIGWCASNGIFAADCIWRICFLVHNCGALQTEACPIFSFSYFLTIEMNTFIFLLLPLWCVVNF